MTCKPLLLQEDIDQINLNENHLESLLYGKFGDDDYKTHWKSRWLRNDILLKEVNELGIELSKIQLSKRPVLVKGVALLHSIYKDIGSRFMSDCDLLVAPSDLNVVKELLLLRGFKVLNTKKWFANEFKIELTKVGEVSDINIELHTKLLYHHDYDKWNKVSLNEYYDTLSPIDHYLYLCAHTAFSHSFLKLYWVFDLYFLNKSESRLDYSQLRDRAKELKVLNSLKMCTWVLHHYFDKEIKLSFSSKLYSNILTKETIYRVKQTGIRYFLIKHFSKDSLILSVKYDVFWVLNKLFGK